MLQSVFKIKNILKLKERIYGFIYLVIVSTPALAVADGTTKPEPDLA